MAHLGEYANQHEPCCYSCVEEASNVGSVHLASLQNVDLTSVQWNWPQMNKANVNPSYVHVLCWYNCFKQYFKFLFPLPLFLHSEWHPLRWRKLV